MRIRNSDGCRDGDVSHVLDSDLKPRMDVHEKSLLREAWERRLSSICPGKFVDSYDDDRGQCNDGD